MYGVNNRIKAAHEKPNYGGKVKPTTPDITKVTGAGPQDKRSLQRDNAKTDVKFNRGAARPWKPKGIPAKSKGSTDVVGEGRSTKAVVRPNIKGYTKVK